MYILWYTTPQVIKLTKFNLSSSLFSADLLVPLICKHFYNKQCDYYKCRAGVVPALCGRTSCEIISRACLVVEKCVLREEEVCNFFHRALSIRGVQATHFLGFINPPEGELTLSTFCPLSYVRRAGVRKKKAKKSAEGIVGVAACGQLKCKASFRRRRLAFSILVHHVCRANQFRL